jgi:hypothetical protein
MAALPEPFRMKQDRKFLSADRCAGFRDKNFHGPRWTPATLGGLAPASLNIQSAASAIDGATMSGMAPAS